MFRKLLIANRGEIAIRVARAARELGVQTAGVYSDGDAGALYRGFVDESYRLGPPPPSESYLRIDLLIEVAVKCGADALHPGYGFLAEDPALSAACRDAGIAFTGPTPEAMERAGDKITARKRMADAGVPVAAGSSALRDAGHAADEAAKIGYPVILKASGGGGGGGGEGGPPGGGGGRPPPRPPAPPPKPPPAPPQRPPSRPPRSSSRSTSSAPATSRSSSSRTSTATRSTWESENAASSDVTRSSSKRAPRGS